MTESGKKGMELLKVIGVKKTFGGVVALNKLSLTVEKNSILGLIGPNGSGKTTLFNVIMGFVERDEGEIWFKGENITSAKPWTVSQKGIGMTFQLTSVFPNLTVLQNMLVPSKIGIGEKAVSRALDLLEFLNIARLRDEHADNLSYGQHKLLELGRVLMLDPELILLDEPAAGVNPVLIQSILDRVVKLRELGKTFVVVEHNMDVVANVCDRLVALDHGEKIAEGKTQDVLHDQKVIDAYLGEG